ncbi:MAG: undecaprenyl-diphosphate phosphatase [Planctomycetaceae bacterium]
MLYSEYLKAILLGVIQGVAEFLPISSSGHLVISSELMQSATGRPLDVRASLQMNVALHLGTLISILVVYRRDLTHIVRDFRMCVRLAVATAPIVLLVLVAHDFIESTLQTAWVSAGGLFVTAGLLSISQRVRTRDLSSEKLPWTSVVLIGISQAIAIVPGISRSGSTISGGLMCGLRRDEASRFSFLIAIPAIAGAVVWETRKILQGEGGGNSPDVLLLGAMTAFIVGLLALRLLIRMVNAGRLHWFAWYCVVVGTATFTWLSLR